MLPIAQIRQAINLFDLASRYTTLRRTGKTAIGLCPVHSEKTPSFRINLPGHKFENLFRCHSCEIHGDCIDFFMVVEQIGRVEAVKRLAAEAGIKLARFTPETPADRRSREAATKEREFCLWWWRQRWKTIRGLLDREMAALEDPKWAACLGRLLRQCERLSGAEGGFTLFRSIVSSEERRQYAVWLKRPPKDAALRENLLRFADFLVERNREHAEKHGWKDLDDFCRLFPEEARRALRAPIIVPNFRNLGTIVIAFDYDPAGIAAMKKQIPLLLDDGFNVGIPDFSDWKKPLI